MATLLGDEIRVLNEKTAYYAADRVSGSMVFVCVVVVVSKDWHDAWWSNMNFVRKRSAYVAPSHIEANTLFVVFVFCSLIRLFSISTLAFAIKAGVCCEVGRPTPAILQPPKNDSSHPQVAFFARTCHSRLRSQNARAAFESEMSDDASCLRLLNERTHKVV